jgi:PAS domain S-box-containing protein
MAKKTTNRGTGGATTERATQTGPAPMSSEGLYKTLIGSLPQKVFAKNRDHAYISCNENFSRDFNLPAEAMIGKNDFDYFPKDLAEKYRADDLRVMKRGKLEEIDEPYVNDGVERVVHTIKTPLRDDKGKIVGILGVFWDITDRKQMEEQLREASQYARSLLEASLDPLVTIGADGKITDVNTATEKVTGVTRQKLIGSDFSDYFTEPAKAVDGYQEVFSKGFVKDYPLTIRHKSGRKTDVLYNATVYRDDAGKVQGVFAAARDVTERKQMEEQLREASQYARSLLEASLDPLVTIGADGKITDVNTATEKVTGVTREKLIGSDFSDYFTEPEKAIAGYQEVFSKGFVKDYPLTVRHVSGPTADVLYNATVYRDENGTVQGVFAAARDITARRQAEEELRRHRDHLEEMVRQRTAAMEKTNEQLRAEITESRRRAEIITKQTQEILELSTPVVQVWDGVVAAPLIGSLDSQRTKRFMEVLLDEIVRTNSLVALVDITGVPIIDTQTGQNLVETFAAVKLLGARVVLTGVRPAIAQTLVHLGIDLSGVETRSSLQAGLRVALDIIGIKPWSVAGNGNEK